jgi:hypothetical protein
MCKRFSTSYAMVATLWAKELRDLDELLKVCSHDHKAHFENVRHEMPTDYRTAWLRLIKQALPCNSYDACPNADYIYFRPTDANLFQCPVCKAQRFKPDKCNQCIHVFHDSALDECPSCHAVRERAKVPCSKIAYFSIESQLRQRLQTPGLGSNLQVYIPCHILSFIR